MSNSKRYFLSHLLPYELESRKHGKVRTGLKEYRLLLTAFLEANQAFKNLELEQFDSLVGENACQIRSVWISILASKSPSDTDCLNKRIISSLKKIDALLNPKSINSLMHSCLSLKDIFEKELLDIHLTAQDVFIIQSYLLTEMKQDCDSTKNLKSICKFHNAAPQKIKKFGDVSIAFTENLLRHLRKKLSIASVEFVREHASFSQKRMVSDLFTITHNALLCIPMFWTYKTVLHAAQINNIHFILHAKFLSEDSEGFKMIDEEYLLFKTDLNGHYIETSPTTADLYRPACVVQGIVTENKDGKILTKKQWRSKIQKNGLLNVILAGAADHRQFPNPELDHLFHAINDFEYDSYKSLAKKEGFSFENPTTFFIQHVYSSRVEKLIKQEVNKDYLTGYSEENTLEQMNRYTNFNTTCCFGNLPVINNTKIPILKSQQFIRYVDAHR